MKVLRKTTPRAYREPRKAPAEGKGVPPMVKWIWMEMQHQKISQLAMQDYSGVETKKFNSWVRGASSPKLVDIEAMVNALGYNLTVSVSQKLDFSPPWLKDES